MSQNSMNQDMMSDQIGAYAPLNLDDCMSIKGNLDPNKAKKVLGDVILCEVMDENEQGEVNRGGIILKEDVGLRTWRRAKVVKVGRLCLDVKEGDVVIYPSDRGIKMVSANHKKYIFLNESRIFYIEE